MGQALFKYPRANSIAGNTQRSVQYTRHLSGKVMSSKFHHVTPDVPSLSNLPSAPTTHLRERAIRIKTYTLPQCHVFHRVLVQFWSISPLPHIFLILSILWIRWNTGCWSWSCSKLFYHWTSGESRWVYCKLLQMEIRSRNCCRAKLEGKTRWRGKGKRQTKSKTFWKGAEECSREIDDKLQKWWKQITQRTWLRSLYWSIMSELPRVKGQEVKKGRIIILKQ